MMPAPMADQNAPKKMMLAPPPARFGINGNSAQSVSFNNIIYLAGQHATDLSQDIKGQTREVCQLIDKLLKESMSDKTKLVRADIFLKDKNMYKEMNEVFMEWVDPKHPPPCTAAVMADFLDDKVLVEITVIAVISMDYDDAKEGAMGEQGMEMAEQKGDEEMDEGDDEEDEGDEKEAGNSATQKTTKGRGRKKTT
jgi:enamine deaminase RidA (YjgF/YER057c/UK114 family)